MTELLSDTRDELKAASRSTKVVMYGLITNSSFPAGLRSGIAVETRQDEFPHMVPSKQANSK